LQKSFKVLSQLDNSVSLQLGSNTLQNLPNSNTYNYLLDPTLASAPLPLYLNIGGKQQKLFDDIKQQLNLDPYNDENTKIYITDAISDPNAQTTFNPNELNNSVIFLEAEHPMSYKMDDGDYNVENVNDHSLQWLATQVATVNSEIPQAMKDILINVNTSAKRKFLMDMFHGGKFRVQSANDRSYVIFYAKNMKKVRSILGTRYRADNTKIKSIRMAANTQAMLKGSAEAAGEVAVDVLKDGALYFVVAGVMDIIQFYANKNEDFAALLGHLGVDMAIGVPVVLAGIAFMAIAAAFGAPALLVVLVGLGTSWAISTVLNILDEHFHWSEKLGNKIRQGEKFMQQSPQLKAMQTSNNNFMHTLLHPLDNSTFTK
jgi:hypothetical protein